MRATPADHGQRKFEVAPESPRRSSNPETRSARRLAHASHSVCVELEPLAWPRDCPPNSRTGFVLILGVFVAAAADLAAIAATVLGAGLWRTVAVCAAAPTTLIVLCVLGLVTLTEARRRRQRRRRRRTVSDVTRSVVEPLPVVRHG